MKKQWKTHWLLLSTAQFTSCSSYSKFSLVSNCCQFDLVVYVVKAQILTLSQERALFVVFYLMSTWICSIKTEAERVVLCATCKDGHCNNI